MLKPFKALLQVKIIVPCLNLYIQAQMHYITRS